VQDLTPMQLKMATRRSLNGSMTVVGDLAQATGPLAPSRWEDVLEHLPERKPARVVGLSVGYRIPAQIMQLADRVMAAATPQLRSPTAVRVGEAAPSIVGVADSGDLFAAVAEETTKMVAELAGSVAVVTPDALVEDVSAALSAAGVAHGRATRNGLDDDVTVVPVSVVKGLELDGVVVVEPARIVADETLGLRALYVALTRPTQRLTVVHAEPLPPAMT
jgi:DNA helicase IV